MGQRPDLYVIITPDEYELAETLRDLKKRCISDFEDKRDTQWRKLYRQGFRCEGRWFQ